MGSAEKYSPTVTSGRRLRTHVANCSASPAFPHIEQIVADDIMLITCDGAGRTALWACLRGPVYAAGRDGDARADDTSLSASSRLGEGFWFAQPGSCRSFGQVGAVHLADALCPVHNDHYIFQGKGRCRSVSCAVHDTPCRCWDTCVRWRTLGSSRSKFSCIGLCLDRAANRALGDPQFIRQLRQSCISRFKSTAGR